MAAVRFVRRPSLYRLAIVIAGITFVGLLLLIVLGMPLLFSVDNLSKGTDLGTAPSWSAIGFAIPVAMLAYTGLETVANLAAETREPGRTLPRSLFVGISAAVVVSFLIAVVALFVSADPETQLGTRWLRAPLVGVADAFSGHLPDGVVDVMRVFIGLTGVVILIAVITTSFSGAGRLAYSLGRYDMLPRAFGRLNRRTLIAPATIISTAAISAGILLIAKAANDPVRFLASLYSFGVLIAFTAAQVAVVRLRFTEPDLERPYRAPGNVRVRGTEVPIAALIGAPLTFVILIFALLTHDAARIAGPIWLAFGALVFVGSRVTAREQGPRPRHAGDRRPRPRSRGHVQAHPRSDEDRPHRRGGARHRVQARRGAGVRDSRPARDPGPSRHADRRGDGRRRGAGRSVARRGEAPRGG